MSDHTAETGAAHVGGNTRSAAIAAALLIYFGFFRYLIPDVTDLFSLGSAIFNYTLRIGGILMAVVAVASMTRATVVLVLDAITSIAIGTALVVSAVLMLAGGGGLSVNLLLYFLFAGMFFVAGVRNGQTFLALRSVSVAIPSTHVADDEPPQRL